jgi:hypothetical protein
MTDLTAVEAEVSDYALAGLASQRIPSGYDLRHLQAFHRAIVGDLYRPVGGELRTVAIAQPQLFCLPDTSPPTPATRSSGSPTSSTCGGWAARRLLIGSPTSLGRSTHCTRSGTAGPSEPFSASSLAMLTIAKRWRVPLEVRARRRSRKPATGQRGTPAPGTKAGKVPRQVHPGHERSDARGADERGDLSRRASSAAIPDPVKPTSAAAAR